MRKTLARRTVKFSDTIAVKFRWDIFDVNKLDEIIAVPRRFNVTI